MTVRDSAVRPGRLGPVHLGREGVCRRRMSAAGGGVCKTRRREESQMPELLMKRCLRDVSSFHAFQQSGTTFHKSFSTNALVLPLFE